MSSLEKERGFLQVDDYTFTDINQNPGKEARFRALAWLTAV